MKITHQIENIYKKTEIIFKKPKQPNKNSGVEK